jgi:ABC-2 type transport system ATP-binding protein
MTPAIEVRSLGVRYNLRLTRRNTLRQSFRNLPQRGGERHFWALRDVSFRVDRGESLAVVGPNGAGKSTLLQVLAGIIEPTEGAIAVDGRVSSLLMLGAGFDPDLSGRDNIALAGAFMGIDHADMQARTPGIVALADIGQFIDAPIKTYSSGMSARLGFSIATAVDPDVLLLDEVLSTGDATFRAKSQERVIQLMGAAHAIVLVTHDMHWAVEFCNRAVLLEHGSIVAAGTPQDVAAQHEARSALRRAGVTPEVLRPLIEPGLDAVA